MIGFLLRAWRNLAERLFGRRPASPDVAPKPKRGPKHPPLRSGPKRRNRGGRRRRDERPFRDTADRNWAASGASRTPDPPPTEPPFSGTGGSSGGAGASGSWQPEPHEQAAQANLAALGYALAASGVADAAPAAAERDDPADAWSPSDGSYDR